SVLHGHRSLLSFPTRRSSDLTMVLGLVRARQGRIQEAESLLHQAIAGIERTDYVAERWEYYLSLAEFLLAQRQSKEADEWITKRSEEHTSELQSRENLVCRLL